MLVIGAGANYLIFHNILPGVFAANPILSGVDTLACGLAWMPALLLGFFAVLSYLREHSRQADARLGPPRTEPAGRSRPPKVPPQPTRNTAGSNTPNPPLPIRNAPTSTQATALAEPTTPQSWALEAIQSLEWKRLELLRVQYYKQMGLAVKTVPHSADGGIDAVLCMAGQSALVAVIQCKVRSKPVKVEQVRALGGSILVHKVKRSVLWSLSGYTGSPVQEFSELAGIQLLDGRAMLEHIRTPVEDK